MYYNTGYVNGYDIEIENNSNPLFVSGCGNYRLLKRSVMSTVRPMGRKDYQLLYISSGKAYFEIDGTMQEVESGSAVVFLPFEPQKYIYYLKDHPEVYWVHFSGSRADEFLREAGFDEQKILYVGTSFDYINILKQLIIELQVKRPCCEEILSTSLSQLFWLFKRARMEIPYKNIKVKKEIENAIHYFNENFSQKITVEEYAKNQHISICWFIRSFKSYTGLPPMQYITSIRIQKAKELLESTMYTVSEIGAIVGYENPLYFSRIFKKQTNKSPMEYRKGLTWQRY